MAVLRGAGNVLRTGAREFQTSWRATRPTRSNGEVPLAQFTHGLVNDRSPLSGGNDAPLGRQTHGFVNRDQLAMPGHTNIHAAPSRRGRSA